MEDITIGQVVTCLTIIGSLYAFYKGLKKAFKSAIQNEMKPFVEAQQSIKQDVAELGDVCYQMLDHMATNNNTGGMKKALDEYNKYNRHN
ncbi:MAG: hypothetical protein Q4C64_02340 [Erysipelotrichia bacterium]|nr:hypothetical protein [Erysipelotrichia bacterium]